MLAHAIAFFFKVLLDNLANLLTTRLLNDHRDKPTTETNAERCRPIHCDGWASYFEKKIYYWWPAGSLAPCKNAKKDKCLIAMRYLQKIDGPSRIAHPIQQKLIFKTSPRGSRDWQKVTLHIFDETLSTRKRSYGFVLRAGSGAPRGGWGQLLTRLRCAAIRRLRTAF